MKGKLDEAREIQVKYSTFKIVEFLSRMFCRSLEFVVEIFKCNSWLIPSERERAVLSFAVADYAVPGSSYLSFCLTLTIQMEATVGLFILLYKVVLTFVSIDEILWCDHSYESYCAILSSVAVYCAVKFSALCVDKIFLWSISLCDDNHGVKIIVFYFHWFNIFEKKIRGNVWFLYGTSEVKWGPSILQKFSILS